MPYAGYAYCSRHAKWEYKVIIDGSADPTCRILTHGVDEVKNMETMETVNGEIHTEGPHGGVLRFKNGKLHSEGDLPSVQLDNGILMWHKHGIPHRGGDRPAEINPVRGYKVWCMDGFYHREGDRPAKEYDDGTRIWCRFGRPHRSTGDPAIIRANGTREWWVDGKLHRDDDLPAYVSANGTRIWFQEGDISRDRGPVMQHEEKDIFDVEEAYEIYCEM